MLYDVHTHRLTGLADTIAITSLFDNYSAANYLPHCSIGVHPWYLDNYTHKLEELARLAAVPNVLAIGECGLDRVCKSDWDLQKEVFAAQVDMAEQYRKPLIIHCVRAYEDVIRLLDAKRVSVPVVIHGFNKNVQVAERLLSKGYYLSFGSAVMQARSHVQDAFSNVPADKFFLETDDTEIAVGDLYSKAAEFRKTSVDGIILQVENNFKQVFGK